VFIDDILIYS
jgi:hypothetical protein